MPYKSREQAAYMHIHHPDIAKRWDEEMKEKGQRVPRKRRPKSPVAKVKRKPC